MWLMPGSEVVTVTARTPLWSLQFHHHRAEVFIFREYARVDEERLHREGAVPCTSVKNYLAVPSARFIGTSRREPGVCLLTGYPNEAEPPGGHPFDLDLMRAMVATFQVFQDCFAAVCPYDGAGVPEGFGVHDIPLTGGVLDLDTGLLVGVHRGYQPCLYSSEAHLEGVGEITGDGESVYAPAGHLRQVRAGSVPL